MSNEIAIFYRYKGAEVVSKVYESAVSTELPTSPKDVLSGLGNLLRIEEGPIATSVSPSALTETFFDNVKIPDNDETRLKGIIGMVEFELGSNGFTEVKTLPDLRNIEATVNDFQIRSTHSIADNGFRYSIVRCGSGTEVFSAIVRNKVESGVAIDLINGEIEALSTLKNFLLSTQEDWVAEQPKKNAENNSGETHSQDSWSDSGLASLLKTINAQPKRPTTYGDLAQVARCATRLPVEELKTKASLLVAKKGSSELMEVVFVGSDVSPLIDQDFLGYLLEAFGDHAELVMSRSTDGTERSLLILESQLAGSYITLLSAALQDLSLGKNIKVDRSEYTGTKEPGVLYL